MKIPKKFISELRIYDTEALVNLEKKIDEELQKRAREPLR